MVATVQIDRFYDSTPLIEDITGVTIRYKRADDNAQNLNNPLVVTQSGTTYSFRKHTKLNIITAPPNQIDNVRWFIDETSAGGATFTEYGFRLYSGTSTMYIMATSSDVTALIAGLANSEALYTSTSPLTVFPGTLCVNTDSFPTYGSQDFVVTQMSVSPTTTVALSPAKAVNYRYDES